MAGKWTTERFPQLANQIQALVEQHRALEDEPLHLAVTYNHERDAQDIFLLEVVSNFGGGEVDPDCQLFEVTFGPTLAFPMSPSEKLHLVLTNPTEFRIALRDNWRSA